MWLRSRNQGQVAIVLKCYANILWPNYAYAWHGFQLHQTMQLLSGWSHRASPCHGLYQFTAEGIGTESRDSVQPHKTQILWPNSLKSEMNLRVMKEHMVRGTLTYDLFFSMRLCFGEVEVGILWQALLLAVPVRKESHHWGLSRIGIA